ncbi:minor capsid protein [Capybara microvirus Cap3_SP_410]|nr:minor capsid protein [Capybara microvirus Cap3_SP_410]
MDDFSWLNGIANLAGVASSAISSASALALEEEQVEEANRINIEQAALNRDFQREMYYKGVENQWNMFDAVNEYNSPLAQRQRLEQAGYNPLSIEMKNSAAQQVGAPSTPSGGAAVAHTGNFANWNMNGASQILANIGNTFADMELKKAQAANLNAQTDRSQALLNGDLKLQNVNISNIQSQTNLNREQAQYIVKSAEKIDSEISKINTEITSLNFNMDLASKEFSLHEIQTITDKEYKEALVRLDNQRVLNEAQRIENDYNIGLQQCAIGFYNAITNRKEYEIHYDLSGVDMMLKGSEIWLNHEKAGNLQIENGLLKIDLDINEKNKDWRIWTERANDVVGVLANGAFSLGALRYARGLVKGVPKVKGFGQ